MKAIVYFMLLLGTGAWFAPSASAQLLVGGNAGIHFPNLHFLGYYYYDGDNIRTESETLTRLTLGLNAEMPIDSKMRITAGLRFVQRGGRYSSSGMYDLPGNLAPRGQYTIEYDYLDIPIGVKAFLNEGAVRFYFGMNGVLGINLRAESQGPASTDPSTIDFSEYARDMLPFVDLLIGLEFAISPSYICFLQINHSRSIISIDDTDSQSVLAREYALTAGMLYSIANIFPARSKSPD